MTGRRELTFDRLGDVIPEVERLLAGHAPEGRWSLGQVLHHLATAVRLTTMPGRAPGPALGPEAARSAEVRRRLFFRAGRFPDGVEAPGPMFLPPPDADERAEAESLRSALRLFEGSDGPFPAHPSLGPLTKGEWDTFHRLHCAHHLGFVRPSPGGLAQPRATGDTLEGGAS